MDITTDNKTIDSLNRLRICKSMLLIVISLLNVIKLILSEPYTFFDM